jgi:hypothetical protein
MIRLLADENFDNAIVRGVRRRNPRVDLVRAQDVGLTAVEDPDVLEWAAQEGRVLLSHDVATITKYAYDRIEAGLSMPGVFEVSQALPPGPVIEDVLLIAEASMEGEWEGQVLYLPLRR